EELAEPTAEAQRQVALRCIESARQAAEQNPADPRVAHIGHHLIGRGRPALEIDVAFVPKLRMRVKRVLLRHAAGFYLGTIAMLTIALVAAAVAVAGDAVGRLLVSLIAFIPATEVAISVTQMLAHRL